MRPTGSIGHMFSCFFYALAALFSRNTERSKGGSVVISHSLLSHGGCQDYDGSFDGTMKSCVYYLILERKA